MAEPFLGEIRLFPFDYAPAGWAQCNGQLLAIPQNQALFSLLGVYYGGNGTTNFALPNLQGRVPLHATPIIHVGSSDGVESVVLKINEMPEHSHQAKAASDGTDSIPGAASIWGTPAGGNPYHTASNGKMSVFALEANGAGAAHTNMQPYLVLNYCIAIQGVYPPRD